MIFANVIIDRKIKELDRYLQYIIPDRLETKIHVGSLVMVPLGKANTPTVGYVMELSDTPDFDVSKTKSVLGICQKRLDVDGEMLVIAHWMHMRYGVTTSKALQVVTPVKSEIKRKEKIYYTIGAQMDVFLQALYEARKKKNMQARARFLEALKEEKILEHSIMIEKLNLSPAVVKPLLERGIIKKQTSIAYRSPIADQNNTPSQWNVVSLNADQKEAVSLIRAEYQNGRKRPCLLHGITGSGKTEVYMELIAGVIQEGKQAILLIPEIALTYQTVMRFYRRFGERVAVMNSRMTHGERYDQYLRAKNGEVDVVIGPRSALFAPLPSPGIIIIDEEHEDSYKNEFNPKYDAHDVAIYRAGLHNAMVVFGSATPCMETNYYAEQGVYRKVTLSRRASDKSKLARTHIVDMRLEMQEGNSSILSRKLHDLIADRLMKQEQIMLFLNRRGYSNYLQCYQCGEVIRCKRCDISMTYHQDNVLRCHYCGASERAVNQCSKCGAKGKLQPMGIGTQKAMALVQTAFPEAKILRMDQDTTTEKNAHQEILQSFADHEADILLGTQMIVKGHDYSNVTLVGILLADRSLNMPSYRASEKTFQLLTQAAGRAGRGEKEGDVVIQTYKPDNFAIQAAAQQDYSSFYQKEIVYRKMLHYPPMLHMMTVLYQSEQEEHALQAAFASIAKIAEDPKTRELMVYGPTEDAIPKINYIYRKVVLLKGTSKSVLEMAREIILGQVSGIITEAIPDRFCKNPTTSKYFTNKMNDVIIEFDIN